MISKFLRLKLLILISIFQAGFAQDYDEYTLEDSVTVTAQKDGKVATYNTIAFKLPIPLRSTPASVSVVPQALLANQGGIVLGDALRNVSGVNCQTGNGVFDYFMIRGFNSLDNGLVMTDGTAEPEVMFYNMYNLERVEVLKGPSAFLYGGNPLSGTVNLVRKTPVFDNFLHLGGSYGQFNA
ncbi:MAG: TonB-dependent receptor plug domain-containing protein, partial [Calditrichaeota bacterium]|nr:TonB-dependent receptor plug domain-containing protein [Calditrichota bacterium]MCB0315343.1 TonB-dependent receptor plug domain-containing protein [Calditrichota bacterium]